jgi:hypothetical protein
MDTTHWSDRVKLVTIDNYDELWKLVLEYYIEVSHLQPITPWAPVPRAISRTPQEREAEILSMLTRMSLCANA